VALRVATYNIGAKMSTMFAGQRRLLFEQKLTEDLQLIGSKADIIGMQEVSPFWHNFISQSILGNWASASIIDHGIVTFVGSSWTVVGSPQTPRVFPPAGSMYREWRRWLQLIVQNDKGDTYLVNNVHIIDGKYERKNSREDCGAPRPFQAKRRSPCLRTELCHGPCRNAGPNHGR
jgi:hypothetical protein